ncbi:MAG: methane monooxygenase/ammonia monooxygenase subunit B [Nitrosomonas sp.]|nr:methane monooxygenase/ammonia monooxygenase subunit B [Nitrosomonas sp.]
MDRKVAWGVAILDLCAGMGWLSLFTESKHPYTIPIQAGESKIEPLPIEPSKLRSR